MKKVLGRKQNMDNQSWRDAMVNIEEYVSRQELDLLVQDTVDSIKKLVNGRRVAFAWSGGKDSLVLEKVCEMAKIEQCMLAVCDLEYPKFIKWVENNKPENLEIVNTGQNLEWLSKHQEMLFPKDSKTAATWFKIVQHRGQEKYYREKKLDMIILGRRKVDGNYVGRDNIYTNRKGITRFSPLAEWPHEAILAFLHYYNISIPPIYSWEKGYLCGTHPWPARQHMKNHMQGWEEVYRIDPIIVEQAAEYIEAAKKFLKYIK